MVYVDDMYKTSIGKFGRMKMSHMISDTTEELLEMVDKIGVQRKWIQHEGSLNEHFDIAMGKRELAIKYGAQPITYRQYGEIIFKRCDSQGVHYARASITPRIK